MSATSQTQVQPLPTTNNASETTSAQEASAKLAEAIDDFLGDLDKKFKNISDEILTRLDDMAERCDRLEQEILLRDSSESAGKGLGIEGSGDKDT